MLHDIMPGTEELLNKELCSAYLGIDPTADSLHIGHLVGIMMLSHLQRCGHQPIALLGGATGMIGDPSGKSQERNLLDEETLQHNQDCIKKHLSKFLKSIHPCERQFLYAKIHASLRSVVIIIICEENDRLARDRIVEEDT